MDRTTNAAALGAANSTCTPSGVRTDDMQDAPIPDFVGFICVVITAVVLSSNFIPVKKYETGDGMFFQWIFCNGIFLSGLVLQMIHPCKVYVLPMLGGVLWTFGNVCIVPTIKTIGMGLGLSIAMSANLCVGWTIGRFGLFGTQEASIKNELMNSFSVVLAFASILIMISVKNEVSSSDTEKITEDTPIFVKNLETRHNGSGQINHVEAEDKRMFFDRLSENKKRLMGSTLSVFSGVMYGLLFTPTLYVQNNYQGASQNGLDYIFAQFCGLYLGSTVFFIAYCLLKKNHPTVYPQVIVPGLISGIVWAFGVGCWNVGNSVLSQAISYPIVASGPCGLASLFWGVLVFKEIKGLRNIAILTVGFSINLTGSLLAGFSK